MDENSSFYSEQTNQMSFSVPSKKAPFTTQVSYLPSSSTMAVPTLQSFPAPTVPVNPMVQFNFTNKPSDSIALRNKFTFMSRTSRFSFNTFMKKPSALSIWPHFDMNHSMSTPAKDIRAPIFSPYRDLPVIGNEYLLQMASHCSCIRSPNFFAFSQQVQTLPPQFGPHYSSFLNRIDLLRTHIDLSTHPFTSYWRSSRSYTCSNCNIQFASGQAFGGHMSYHSKIRKSVRAFGEDKDPSRRAKLQKTISLFPEHREDIGLRPPADLPMPNAIDLNVSYELNSFCASKTEEKSSEDGKGMRELINGTQKVVSVLTDADMNKSLEEMGSEAAGCMNKAGEEVLGLKNPDKKLKSGINEKCGCMKYK